MGGLAILLIVVLYIAVVTWLAFKVKHWGRKALLLLVAFLLPTADGYLGRKYVEHLCAKDGGLKVFRVVENVEGVMGLAPDKATLERTGFRFIEIDRAAADPGRAYRRIERLPDGEIVEVFDAKPRAKYEVGQVFGGHRFLIAKDDLQVTVVESGEVLARVRKYSGGAGWAERFLAQFSDAGYAGGTECAPPKQPITLDEFVQQTLRATPK